MSFGGYLHHSSCIRWVTFARFPRNRTRFSFWLDNKTWGNSAGFRDHFTSQAKACWMSSSLCPLGGICTTQAVSVGSHSRDFPEIAHDFLFGWTTRLGEIQRALETTSHHKPR